MSCFKYYIKWKLIDELVVLRRKYPQIIITYGFDEEHKAETRMLNLDGLSFEDEKAVVIRCFTFAVEEQMIPPIYDNHTLTFRGDRYSTWEMPLK